MGGFWLTGMSHAVSDAAAGSGRIANQTATETKSELRELQRQVERMALLNQALWELLREKLQLTDLDLEAMAQQVGMRDGVADERITAQAVRCPNCSRVNNSRHAKCLYCGQLFERPLFG